MPTPSLERMCWRPSRPKPDGLSCEIARIFTRAIPLTTGTFNLVVKDRIALRLSGAHSVQSRDTQVRLCLSSKPYKVTVRAEALSTLCAHRISTGNTHVGTALGCAARAPSPADFDAQQDSSSGKAQAHDAMLIFGTSRGGRFFDNERS